MNRSRRARVLVFFMLLSFVPAPSGQAATGDNRPRLTLAYTIKSFYDIDVKDGQAALALWSREIGDRLGYGVESVFYDDPDILAHDFMVAKVDLAVFTSDEYLKLNKRPDFGTALTVMRGGKKTQKFLLLVPMDSPYYSLKDLRNKKLSMTQSGALGFTYLEELLMKQGMAGIDNHFASVERRAKVSQAILAVFFKQVDACITNEMSYKTMAELNPQIEKKLRIIATSPEFVLGAALLNNSLTAQKKQDLVNAILTMGEKPRGRQVLNLFKTDRFVLVEPGELESVRDLIGNSHQLKRSR